jgi:hypothetical protein
MPIDADKTNEQWARFQFCVSGEAKVVTSVGYVALKNITAEHLVFDGVEFVACDGVVSKGEKPCVRIDGIEMTPDHKVLSEGEWVEAQTFPHLGRDYALRFNVGSRSVFDILNCGPRARFAVVGDTGLVIAHNCRDRGHLDFVQKADKCDKYVIGEQWLQTDLNTLQLQRRPAITVNKILSTISTILGEQIYNRTEVLFRPSNGAPDGVAEALNKVWMQISQDNQLPWVRSDVFCDGIIRSRGFYDVRMDFADDMQGEVSIDLLNSKNVIVDPDAEEYDPDYWNDVFITKWLTWQDVAVLYNEEDAEYLRDFDVSGYPYGYDSIERVRDRFAGAIPMGGYYGVGDRVGERRNIRVLERQYRKLDKQEHFVDVVTGDMRPIPLDWDRNRIAALLEKAGGQISTVKKLIKRIRWMVTAGNVVLHDDWSPYKHFTVVPFFPHFRYGRTVGIVENLLGPQEILNKVSSQELHIVNSTANGGWKIEENSLVNMSVEELEVSGAQTGLVIEYKKGAQPPEKIQPNQTPTGLDRVSYKAEEHIKTISNVSDSMQGFDREDVAAKAIAYKRQQGSVNLTKVMDNLQRTDWILARNVLDLVQQYYTEERVIHVTHEDVTREAERITVNQPDPSTGAILNDLTLGEYNIVITTTPYRDSLEDSQFEQARALREMGVAIPDDVLIENSRLQRRQEIIKRMAGDEAAAALKQRADEANVANLEADVQTKQADVLLKQAKAQKEAQPEGDQDPQAEFDLERYKIEQDAALKREQMDQEFALKREQMEREFALKQAQAAQEAELRARESAAQQEAQRAAALRQSSQPTPTKEE